MASLISAGAAVSVINDSMYSPNEASTVPLIFIATAEEKTQPGAGNVPALGTYESGVVRTITSIPEMISLYGYPRFLQDSNGQQHHGDARNEYGLYALYQYLQEGSRAYVVRANVNLNDDVTSVRTMWDAKMQESATVLENMVSGYINTYNRSNGLIASSAGFKTTVSKSELISLAEHATADIWDKFTFRNVRADFFADNSNPATATAGYQFVDYNGQVAASNATGLLNDGTLYTAVVRVNNAQDITISIAGNTAQTFADLIGELNVDLGAAATAAIVAGNIQIVSNATGAGSSIVITNTGAHQLFTSIAGFNLLGSSVNGVTGQAALPIYANGYNQMATGAYVGFNGFAAEWMANALGASSVPTEFTPAEASGLLLDAADEFKFTLEFLNQTSLGANDAARRVAIVNALQATINSCAEVRSETYEYNLILCPGYPEVVDELIKLNQEIEEEAFVIGSVPLNVDPAGVVDWAATPARQHSNNLAYYYPHSLESNLDGVDVMADSAGVALRTYAYSDKAEYVWSAPAGSRRGIVNGSSGVGYASGELGGATTFVQTSLNRGHRDNMYKFFTHINPIVFFPNRGTIVFGQKTSANVASALDRVNVARLVCELRRRLRKNAFGYIFQPNDQLTRDDLKSSNDGILTDVMSKRGLYDFASYCNESNNTPDRIDRNEMYYDVAIKPTKTAEFIYIPIRVVNTGDVLKRG